eukprot:1158818-Pelagomonas_calceolata.AAC.4
MPPLFVCTPPLPSANAQTRSVPPPFHTWGAPSSKSSRAYGAAISLMSKRASKDLPMPSSTVKERTTKCTSSHGHFKSIVCGESEDNGTRSVSLTSLPRQGL